MVFCGLIVNVIDCTNVKELKEFQINFSNIYVFKVLIYRFISVVFTLFSCDTIWRDFLENSKGFKVKGENSC